MSDQENAFLKKLQSTLWTAFGGLLLLTIVAVVPFYFNTKNELKHTKDEVRSLKNSKADKAIYELTVRQIRTELTKINNKLDE